MVNKIIQLGIGKPLIIFVAILLIVFVAINICIIVSNNYIKTHSKNLYNNNVPLTEDCRYSANAIINDIKPYYDCITKLGINETHNCSNSVVGNASNAEVKYLIKYSDIEYDEESLELVDFCIDWRTRLDNLFRDLDKLSEQLKPQLPLLVRIFTSSAKLPYKVCDIPYSLTKIENPSFTFSYVSPAGRSSNSYDIKVTPSILSEVQEEIYVKIHKNERSKTQRNLMTNDLREAIKQRDNYTCQICGNSVFKEPNLLLEVDHIIPISKGGKTEASNLQTLCWRCNRKKSDNLI